MTTLVLNRKDATGTHCIESVLSVKNESSNTEIELYDMIVPWKFDADDPAVTVSDITNVLNNITGDITLRVNSRGGEVGTALTIYNRIKAYDKGATNCIVDGYAFSSAGWIPMACDHREIATGGIFMNHNPQMYPEITSLKDLESVKSQWEAHHTSIVDIFEEATDIPREEITDMMDKETFLSADDAVEAGFFHAVSTNRANLDALNVSPVKSIPESLSRLIPDVINLEEMESLRSQRNRLSKSVRTLFRNRY